MFRWIKWPAEFTLSARPDFAQDFPNLQPHFCEDDLSSATRSYNCLAWAASITNARWEPDPLLQYHWPDGVPREYTLDAYIAAFRTKGFEVCTDGSVEAGMEKIAIYSIRGEPQHAARQLANGNWTSKMGDYEDIQHTSLNAVGGPLYGNVRVYMKRKVA